MEYNTFCAFLTATDTEQKAQFALFDWEEFKLEGDSQVYYKSSVKIGNEEKEIIMTKQNEMGMVVAAVTASKVITQFKPQYIIMTGIAAGIEQNSDDAQEYGDVMVVDHAWNYSNGKYVDAKDAVISFGNIGFKPRPLEIEIDDSMRNLLEKAIASEDNQCHVRIGSMACGFGVIANSEYVDAYIRSQYGETAGLDMESYAVMYAAKNAPEPRPKALVIKSVCDFADGRKDDKYQSFAAYTSTEFAKFLLENYL